MILQESSEDDEDESEDGERSYFHEYGPRNGKLRDNT